VTDSYFQEAQALARKAIGWRNVALEERRRREDLERARDVDTRHALEHFQPHPDADAISLQAHLAPLWLWVRDQAKRYDGQLTEGDAGVLLDQWCRQLLTVLDHSPNLEAIMSTGTLYWPLIRESLETGSFDDWQQWSTLVLLLHPPPLDLAIMDTIVRCAPIRMGSDPVLELQGDNP
jgi:hypothetical protein